MGAKKWTAKAFAAVSGAVTLYSILLSTTLALHLSFLWSAPHSYMGHSDYIGWFLSRLMILLLSPAPVIIIAAAGGIIGAVRAGKHDRIKWGFGGKRLPLIVLLPAAALVMLDLPQQKSLLRYSDWSKGQMKIVDTTDLNLLTATINDRNSKYRRQAFYRLGRLITCRVKGYKKYKRIEFTDAHQEQEVFNTILSTLRDEEILIRLAALQHMDDFLKIDTGVEKSYLTRENLHRIRGAYLEAIESDKPALKQVAMENLVNLPPGDDADGEVYYRRQVLDYVSELRDPRAREKPPVYGTAPLLEALFKAMNRRPRDFLEVREWAIELKETFVPDNEYGQRALKEITRFLEKTASLQGNPVE